MTYGCREHAYFEGVAAKLDGRPITDNPYDPTYSRLYSALNKKWHEGFSSSAKETDLPPKFPRFAMGRKR